MSGSSASSATPSNRSLDLTPSDAESVLESLRSGIPPRRFVSAYAVGNEELLDGVEKRHLLAPSTRGKIRFASGSWGAGKTHFLRLLRERAFGANFLVSSVEVSAEQTPFNKFEMVFFEIVRNIASPAMYRDNDLNQAASFGEVLRRALFGTDATPSEDTVSAERLQEGTDALMKDQSIDIDFRRMVVRYWQTYLPEGADFGAIQDVRGKIMQWFSGEGTIGNHRSEFGVQKLVNRSNARLMLQSLSRFSRHIGHNGIVVLLDEAEASYSSMRKSNLKQAHNNLLHLINSIEESEGLILIYAATPDFFVDSNHGILRYGALAQRIGRPEERAPRGLDRVWNLDRTETTEADYLEAVRRIRRIYITAYPEVADKMAEDHLLKRIAELVRIHPEFSTVRTWRVVVTGTLEILDSVAEDRELQDAEQLHDDIMASLRNG